MGGGLRIWADPTRLAIIYSSLLRRITGIPWGGLYWTLLPVRCYSFIWKPPTIASHGQCSASPFIRTSRTLPNTIFSSTRMDNGLASCLQYPAGGSRALLLRPINGINFQLLIYTPYHYRHSLVPSFTVPLHTLLVFVGYGELWVHQIPVVVSRLRHPPALPTRLLSCLTPSPSWLWDMTFYQTELCPMPRASDAHFIWYHESVLYPALRMRRDDTRIVPALSLYEWPGGENICYEFAHSANLRPSRHSIQPYARQPQHFSPAFSHTYHLCLWTGCVLLPFPRVKLRG